MKILFVCTGNICRSPAAESIFREYARNKGFTCEVDSAGTENYHIGQRSNSRMIRAAESRGYPMNHRARQFKSADFAIFDRIVAMDETHVSIIQRMAPDDVSRQKIIRMADYASRYKISHIEDPYYGNDQLFETVLDHLEDTCEGLLNECLKT